MRNQPIPSIPPGISSAKQDQMSRKSVLMEAIDLHTIQATVSELVRLLSNAPEDWCERDRIERAVVDLSCIGLLHRHDFLNRPDSLVTPTQAAFVANELLMDEYE
ncbi:MAG: hypothetical protein ACREP9_14870, partial [Candidatus Dormibacteraceae bacterium]